MFGYIIRSTKKFKEDAASKMFYDIAKWLLATIAAAFLAKYIPEGTTLNTFLSKKVELSVYQILFCLLTSIFITLTVTFKLFGRKYTALQNDHFTDTLTGLKNHRALKNWLAGEFTSAAKNTKGMSFILIDVDNFKKVNDDFGYGNADDLLRKIGELLGNDRRAGDETYRFFERGDEFLIVLVGSSLKEAKRAADRKRQLIGRTTFEVSQQMHRLTVCCGITEIKKDNDTYDAIINRVTSALRLAKSQPHKNASRSVV